ncbi:hypothetical protein ACA910_020671 [Epithemia clementina (nom. ined.)]
MSSTAGLSVISSEDAMNQITAVSEVAVDSTNAVPDEQTPPLRLVAKDTMELRVSAITMASFSEFSTTQATTTSTSSTATPDLIPALTGKLLFCREEEETILFRAYRRVQQVGQSSSDSKINGEKKANNNSNSCTQLVMIHGRTGVGKTSLAFSLRETVLGDGGYFVSGKFDQYQGPKPQHNAFSTAIAQFCFQVLERGDAVKQNIRQRILDNVGSEGRVLTRVIPELVQILGDQEPEQDDTAEGDRALSSEASNMFKYLFRLFVQAISSPDRPIVLLLDDVHWADESSLDLLWSLVNDSPIKGVLFLCTLRDETDTLLIEKQLTCLSRSVECTKIHLDAFTDESVNKILSKMLNTPEDKTRELTTTVSQQTKGNIFFVIEFLRTMKEKQLLQYNKDTGQWWWDIEEISIEFDGVRDLLEQRLQSLSEETLELLKVAACLGSKVNEEPLGHFTKMPILRLLVEASDRGLLVFNHSSSSFEFSHDGIKDVVYNTISPSERDKFHYQLGRRLWKAYPAEDLFNNNIIYVIVGQLMLGKSQINDTREKSAVAKPCLQSGIRAMKQSSFSTAFTFLMQGIELLGLRGWHDEYDLCLGLHNFAAEVAYCTANFDAVFSLVNKVFENTKAFTDTLQARATNVYALGGSGRMEEALESGLSVLKQLGVKFPEKLRLSDVGNGLRKTVKLLKGRSMESLLRLPILNDSKTVAVMHMLNLLFVYAFFSKMELAPFLGFKMVEITVNNGICAVSCVGFGIYAMLLCGAGNDIDEAYRYGKLAMAMLDRSSSRAWLCRVSAAYYGCVYGWKRPVQECIEPLRNAFRIGIECGDIEFAMVNANIMFWNQLNYASLSELDQEIASVTDRMKFYGQETNLKVIIPYWQFLNNLMGKARDDPKLLIGDVYDETTMDVDYIPTVSSWNYYHRMVLSYMVGDYDQAFTESQGCEVLISHPLGAVDTVSLIFFVAMTNLAKASRARKKTQKYIAKAVKYLKYISHVAKHCPLNFLGQQFLLEAELCVLRGDHFSVLAKYTSAVAVLREAGMLMPTALANERAGRYFLSVGNKEIGHPFLMEAVRLYSEWGSLLKLNCLVAEFGGMVDF